MFIEFDFIFRQSTKHFDLKDHNQSDLLFCVNILERDSVPRRKSFLYQIE